MVGWWKRRRSTRIPQCTRMLPKKFPASEIPSFNLNGSRLPFLFRGVSPEKLSSKVWVPHLRLSGWTELPPFWDQLYQDTSRRKLKGVGLREVLFCFETPTHTKPTNPQTFIIKQWHSRCLGANMFPSSLSRKQQLDQRMERRSSNMSWSDWAFHTIR